MKRPLLTLLFLMFAWIAQAQTSDTANNCIITGSVVDSVTGQPLAGAQVFARGMPTGGSGRNQSSASATDTSGEFKLDNLAPGHYTLRAMHPGYVDQSRRGGASAVKPIVLSAGQHVDGFVLSLTPGGIVSGHITDEGGKPISGASVTLMKNSYNAGRRDSSEAASATSDETGEYRFSGLSAGKYYLRATSPPAAPSKKADSSRTYVPIYYPKATDQAGAALLDVQPGMELGGMDLSFSAVHTVRITGQVIDSRTSLPGKGAEISLLSDQGNSTFPAEDITTGAKGDFEIKGVPPGSYIVVAQSTNGKDDDHTIWGKTPVEVADANVSGIKVIISEGSSVTGHIRADSKANFQLEKLTATLEPRDKPALVELMPDIATAPVAADGTFTFRGVPEGSFDLSFAPLPAGTYLKTTNGGEPLDTITIGRGHGGAIPDVTVSAASAWISGTVSNDNQPSAGATVVLVPQGKRQNQAHYYKSAVSDKNGAFTIRGIAPGDYKLFAWEEVDRNAYMDPDFMRDYEDRGQSVRIEDTSQTNLHLEVIPASDMAH